MWRASLFGVATRGLRLALLAISLLVAVIFLVETIHAQRVQGQFGATIRLTKQTVVFVSELQSTVQWYVSSLTHLLLVSNLYGLVGRNLQLFESRGSDLNSPLQWERLPPGDAGQKQVLGLHYLATQIVSLQQELVTRIDSGVNPYRTQLERLGNEAQARASPGWLWVGLAGAAVLFATGLAVLLVRRRMRKQQQLLDAEIAKRTRLEQEVESRIEERTRKLVARTEHLHEAQRIARMGCWEWDLQSGKMDWSDELYAILGLNRKSVSASLENLLEHIHPDDRDGVERAMMGMVELGVPIDIDFRLYHDGSERVVQNRMVVEHRDEKGKPTYLLGTLQDITERKRVEEQLRLAASVFAHTGDGVMITDSNNKIIEVNQAFTRILGYSAADVIGQAPSVLKSPRHRRSFYRSMWQSLQKNGQWQGEIWDKHKSGDIVPLWMTINTVYDERSRLRHYVALFRDISEVKRNEQTLWHIAHHDPLTGLPNRNLMYDRLRVAMSEAAREDLQVALLLIDLDGFKRINDEMGHDAGDALLTHVAQTLSDNVRESDTVARYAGDEFVAVIKGMHEREDVGSLAHKLIDVLSQPQLLKGNQIIVGASIGIALYPAHATDAGELIAKADEAMYHAKRLGKGRSCFFGDDCDD